MLAENEAIWNDYIFRLHVSIKKILFNGRSFTDWTQSEFDRSRLVSWQKGQQLLRKVPYCTQCPLH